MIGLEVDYEHEWATQNAVFSRYELVQLRFSNEAKQPKLASEWEIWRVLSSPKMDRCFLSDAPDESGPLVVPEFSSGVTSGPCFS